MKDAAYYITVLLREGTLRSFIKCNFLWSETLHAFNWILNQNIILGWSASALCGCAVLFAFVGRSEGSSSSASESGCWLISHTKRSKALLSFLVSITTAWESVRQNGCWQEERRADGAHWTSEPVLASAPVWAGHERSGAREEWCVAGPKGWVAVWRGRKDSEALFKAVSVLK